MPGGMADMVRFVIDECSKAWLLLLDVLLSRVAQVRMGHLSVAVHGHRVDQVLDPIPLVKATDLGVRLLVAQELEHCREYPVFGSHPRLEVRSP